MLKKSINNTIQPLFHLLYPKSCNSCHQVLMENEEFICLECLLYLPKTNYHHIKENDLEKVFWGRIPFERGMAFLYFKRAGKVQRMLHALKYKSRKDLALHLGKLYAKETGMDTILNKIDMIIPVPLHENKFLKRGYNQSEEFAKGLASITNITLKTDILFRLKESETQTKKTRIQRWENVNDIFYVKDPAVLSNKHILLIDDVITTGATIEACAQTLLKNPETKLSVLALAFATK